MTEQGGLIVYTSDDGLATVSMRLVDQTVWLTQMEIAELFATSKQNVSLHIKNILNEGELAKNSVVKEYLTTAADGKDYRTLLYSLPLILAIGYRVRSVRGTQFRQWATRNLTEYLVKGFVMDDERLKNPGGGDYFDELLERIREMRASEKRFYQKVRDLFALSTDYQDDVQSAQLFFAEVQNKLLFAVTDKTASEIVVARADAHEPHMALTSWSGSRVRKQDVLIAKNYLTSDEIDSLNRLVVIFLEQAELRVKERRQLTLEYWRTNVDRLLEFNDKPILQGAGSISHEAMKSIVHSRYQEFDDQRRTQEAKIADREDLAQLEELERQIERQDGGK
jgi:hypothetical protein